MKKTCIAAIIVAVLAAFSVYLPFNGLGQEKKSPPPDAPTDRDPKAYHGINPEQIEKLEKGEVVILKAPEDLMGRELLVAAMIFNQDIDTVWDLMMQTWRQEEFLPGCHGSKLVRKWEGGDLVDFQVRILGVKIDYRIQHFKVKSRYYFHWTLDPEYDNDMKEVMGFYRYYWIDENHTLARYGTSVETKVLIPPKIQKLLLKQSLPEALGAAKKWVDSGGTYKKERHETPEEKRP